MTLKVVAVVGLTLAVIEFTVRMLTGNFAFAWVTDLDPTDGRCVALRPGVRVSYTGMLKQLDPVIQEVNRLGYRGPELPEERTTDSLRIACIGDSFVYGQGVNQGDSLPQQLSNRLQQHRRDVEVMNFGIPGLSLDGMRIQFERFAARWHPDLVLLFLMTGRDDLDGGVCNWGPSPIVRRILPVYRTALLAWFLYLQATTEIPEDPVEIHDGLQEGLQRFHEVAARLGVPVAIIILHNPFAESLSSEDAIGRLEKLMAKQPYPWVLLDESTMKSIPGDGHLTAESTADITRQVADWLVASRVVAVD